MATGGKRGGAWALGLILCFFYNYLEGFSYMAG